MRWTSIAFALAGALFPDEGVGRYRDGIHDALMAKQVVAGAL